LNLYCYCINNPIKYVDPSGNAWYHWVIGAAIVALLAVATIYTAGGAVAAFGAVTAAMYGVSSASALVTVMSYALVGSSLALAGVGMHALATSSSVDEFMEQGNWGTVASIVTGGIYGAYGGYLSWNEQIGKPQSWSNIRSNYWKEKGHNRSPIGDDGYPIELNHPYGRCGSKVYLFEEMTHTEHLKFHQMYGYGRGNGGFNRYYPFENIWKWLNWL